MPKKQTILSATAIFVVGLLTYYSASRIGLVHLDWTYLEPAARLSLPQYLVQYFDPRLQTGWYRPIFGIFWLVQYTFSGADPAGYHLAHIVFHAANGVLLFVLVQHVSRNTRVAVIASLVYVGLPVYSKAVYWPSVADPLSAFIYLLAIWCWIVYLETEKMQYAVAAFIAFVVDLMTKESGVTLPIVLFLADRLLVRRNVTHIDLIRRYAPYVVVMPIYLFIEYAIQHNGSYVIMANYGTGSHMLSNLIDGMALVAFPWELDVPARYIWLGIAVTIFLAVTTIKRNKEFAFLGIFALLNLLPVIGFPKEWFETRYVYTSTMASAVLMGYLFEASWIFLGRQRWFGVLASGVVVLILFVNYVGVSDAVANWGEIARQRRVPFREIVRNHPTFPENTILYFADTPTVPLNDLSVMFLLRYGKGIVVKGAAENQIANLRDHPVSYIYYFDPEGRPVEVAVDKQAQTRISLPLPIDFAVPVRLEGYEVAQSNVKRGDALVLLLYWRALGKVEKDYTVFVHLVDEKGQMLAGYDSQPRGGKAPTSKWEEGRLLVDPRILPIATDVPPGKYRLEIGLYYLPTQERLMIVNEQGAPIADQIIFAPLQIAE